MLSGYGAIFGSGIGTLALNRLGGGPGERHRYHVHFDADVHTAGWLSDLRFFLAAAGHSAVGDLARSTARGARTGSKRRTTAPATSWFSTRRP